ncbi:MAG: hypothetical protein HFG05_06195 [Oscillibacter sp.]|nr:hypothetical protein [Oscillibacter sp.]
MSVQTLLNTQPPTESRHAAFQPGTTPCASFQAQLEQAASGVSPNRLPPICMGENVAASGSHAGKNGVMQGYCAHYTENSTPEDPVVRITGVGDSGPFDFLCHLNDVNPANASYVELAALRGHLAKTGVYTNSQYSSGPLPYTMDFRDDITQKHNFIAEIQNSLTQPSHIIPTPSGILGAKELLALYQNYVSGDSALSPQSASALDHSGFMKKDLLSALADLQSSALDRMKKAKEQEEEQESWERLMKYLDAWIESLREEADIRKIARAHAALMSLQTDVEQKDSGDYIIDQLTELLGG